MDIKSVALMGAGAVGAYIISNLTEAAAVDFSLVADGDRARRLTEQGVGINDHVYRPRVKSAGDWKAEREAGKCAGPDLLIIATKYAGLKASLPEIAETVGDNTQVLVIMNGIDSEEIVGSVIGEDKVIPSFIRIVSARKGDQIRFDPACTDGIFFGEKDGTTSERVSAISKFFSTHGIHHRVSKRILAEQWNKFGLNISNNLPQAVVGVGYGAYYDSEHLKFIQAHVTAEMKQVAAAEGYEIEGLPSPREISPDTARFSTLQDLDAGRPTEIDMFLGVLLKKAQQHGISTPYCEYTYHAIKVLEEKNAGKFDYGA